MRHEFANNRCQHGEPISTDTHLLGPAADTVDGKGRARRVMLLQFCVNIRSPISIVPAWYGRGKQRKSSTNRLSCPIIVDNRLNERDWGSWQNKSRTSLPHKSETLKNIWREENLDENPHEGESTLDLMNRIEEFMKYLVIKHAASDVILLVRTAARCA